MIKVRRRWLTLKFRLARNRIAVNLIPTAHHAVERPLLVTQNHILPDRVVARLKVALELIGVDAG